MYLQVIFVPHLKKCGCFVYFTMVLVTISGCNLNNNCFQAKEKLLLQHPRAPQTQPHTYKGDFISYIQAL